MRQEKLPWGSRYSKRFPDCRYVWGGEGWALYVAEQAGNYYLILDEGTLADFLTEPEDADLLDQLVTLFEFETAIERQEYINNLIFFQPLDGIGYLCVQETAGKSRLLILKCVHELGMKNMIVAFHNI